MPVAFCSVINFPHPKIKAWKEHRLVCLPEYQGIGIGNALADWVASYFKTNEKKYLSCTSHPAIISYRIKSPKWKMTSKPNLHNKPGKTSISSMDKTKAVNRLTASFEFI